jgi:hypothetical protein
MMPSLKECYDNYCFGFGYEQLQRKQEGKKPQRFVMLRFVLSEISVTFRYRLYGNLACKYFGHGDHYHSEDWGGPESGGMAGYCDRCGFSFSHTMY